MDWRLVDERLIRRGELLLSLDFLDDYDSELSLSNDGKVGGLFKITDGYIDPTVIYNPSFYALKVA
jgi:hypothetical protein